jgi:hypothetical protein
MSKGLIKKQKQIKIKIYFNKKTIKIKIKIYFNKKTKTNKNKK